MPYFYESDTFAHSIYSIYTASNRAVGVWIKASERHANGEKVSLDKHFSMNSLDLLTFVIRERVSRTVKCAE